MKVIVLLVFLTVNSFIFSQNIDFKKTGIDGSKHIPVGLDIGDSAPLIDAVSIHGERVHSDSILSEKQIVLIFYRGKWCPLCNKHLSNLSDSLDLILEKDAIVLVVGPEAIENAEKTEQKADAKFTIIADENEEIQTNFDVLFSVIKSYQRKIRVLLFTDISKNNNQEEAQLPVPATYIIDSKGTISYKHFDYDYSNRASVKDILDNL